MGTFRRILSVLLVAAFCLPTPDIYALRVGQEAESQNAGLEQKLHSPHPREISSEQVALRLMDALLQLSDADFKTYLDPAIGKITLNSSTASSLLKNKPTPHGFRFVHKDGTTLAQRVNSILSNPETSPTEISKRWERLFQRKATSIEIAKNRDVDTKPWTEKRLKQVANQARKEKLSFKQHRIMGAQAEMPLGKELKSLLRQIISTDNFPKYKRNWALFLKAHGIPLEEGYEEGYSPQKRATFSVYADLKRNRQGIPILDQRKHIADLKLNRLDSLWDHPRVRRSRTLFLVGIRTWADDQNRVVFSHKNKTHATSLASAEFDPSNPFRLVLEIAVHDPYHAVQVARRADTGEVVYPFEGQTRFYINPSFQDGRMDSEAFLFFAARVAQKGFKSEIASLGAELLLATHVPIRTLKHSSRAYFQAGGGWKSLSMALPADPSSVSLTVQINPKTWQYMAAWTSPEGKKVFPRLDGPPKRCFGVFLDPSPDPRGLVAEGKPDAEVSDPRWAYVWKEVVPSQAEKVIVQGVAADTENGRFSFEGELYPISLDPKDGTPMLEVQFLAQDPHRRPQAARRMDTGEVVYPGSRHRRIVADGKLYKAVHQIGRGNVNAAFRAAKHEVRLENLPTIQLKGRLAYWDPLAQKNRWVRETYRPGVFLTAVVEKKGRNKLSIDRIQVDNEERPASRESRAQAIARAKNALFNFKKSAEERALAVEHLYRLGYLNTPNGITTDLLHDLLFDYHGKVFERVGAEPFFQLSNRAADLHTRQPARYWSAVYHPLVEAEQLPPNRAAQRLAQALQSLTAGLEEEKTKTRRRFRYDSERVAVRLMDALLRLDSLAQRDFFDSKSGQIRLNSVEAAELLRNHPTSAALRQLRESGKSLMEEVSDDLSKPELAIPVIAKRWPFLFHRGVFGIEITKSREVDTQPWTNGRLSKVTQKAKEQGLSFHQQTVQFGAQATASELGRALKSAHGQITKTDRFPQYERSWPKFLAAHGIALKESYLPSHPPRERLNLSLYVDLERDGSGLLILDRSKKIADLKIGLLTPFWKNPRVHKAKTLFLVGSKTWVTKNGYVVFGYGSDLYSTQISAQQLDPKNPPPLALELAVEDPRHSVQAAYRLDTGKQVYPFKGQLRYYIDPLFDHGRIHKGAYLFQAFSWPARRKFWKKVAQIKPKRVFVTNVKTTRRHKTDTAKAYFNVGSGPVSTELLAQEGLPRLTVELDPVNQEPIRAWKMSSGRLVFPRTELKPSTTFKVFVDPQPNGNGRTGPILQVTSDREVTNPAWERVWSEIVPPAARKIVIQGTSTFQAKPYNHLVFSFSRELFPTSIRKDGECPALQIEFKADDPDRRPQVARRMDTGQIVYPAPHHRRIIVDGKLWKASSVLNSKVVKDAVRHAKRQVIFENIQIVNRAGKAGYWDPLAGKERGTAVEYRPEMIRADIISEADGRGHWGVVQINISDEKDPLPPGSYRETVARNKGILFNRRKEIEDRVEAAHQLFRSGYLEVPSNVTTDYLRDLLFDYHSEVFGSAGREPFFLLSTRAAQRYSFKPGLFWEKVYEPLREAELLEPHGAARTLKVAADALTAALPQSAGLEQSNVLVLLDPKLFSPAELAQLDDFLMALGIRLREILTDGTLEIQVELLTNALAQTARYPGWQIIAIAPPAAGSSLPLPAAALPQVINAALRAGRARYEVDSGDYQEWANRTLQQELDELGQLRTSL